MGVLEWLGVSRQETSPPPEAKTYGNDALARLIARDGGVGVSDAGVVVNETTVWQGAAAAACTALISNDVATMPLMAKRLVNDRAEKALDAPEFDLLFRRPNPLHTAFEFRQMMTAQAVLRGNAYAFKVRNGRGVVTELWPLMADEVQARRDGYEIKYTLAAYDGRLVGEYGGADIFHLRSMMWDGVSGLDRMRTARNAIGLSSAAEGAQSKAFRNGVRMPGYWSTDNTLKDDELVRLAESLMAASTGENAFKSPVLDAGLNYKPTAQNFSDAQMIETRKQQIIEVCAHFGVVPAVLGLDDKTQAFASVEAMMRWHLQHTLRPWLTAWEQAIDRDILDGAAGPLFAKFDTSDMEKASTAERAQSYRDLVELGVMTRNEVRELEGLPPLDGLDDPLTPLNMQGGADDGGEDEPED